ncbi:hypothetical protein OIDMADRAFT_183378 [Oidiodendron maius Zn]|uniref:Uncharacterized protein n=1 Tax=Oidiodendron maius (strain Zn) TaxID=913774 RepID=A0A0C3CAE3_OIDMZ|nr:hypothetical protein OIDMADRAFT_183378 [Oidiodendron maius Zn]
MKPKNTKGEKSAFVGPGQRLGDGKVVGRKKTQPTEDNDDYILPKDDSEDDNDSSVSTSGAEEAEEEDLNYLKVQNLDGTYIKVQNGDMAEESEENEDEIIRKVKGDLVFESIARRGASRLAMVILAYQEDDPHSKVYDFSDSALDTIDPKATAKFIECKNGAYKQVQSRSGSLTYVPLKADELGQAEDCDCIVCAARRRNVSTISFPAKSTRSGKIRGIEKYGPGRTLG